MFATLKVKGTLNGAWLKRILRPEQDQKKMSERPFSRNGWSDDVCPGFWRRFRTPNTSSMFLQLYHKRMWQLPGRLQLSRWGQVAARGSWHLLLQGLPWKSSRKSRVMLSWCRYHRTLRIVSGFKCVARPKRWSMAWKNRTTCPTICQGVVAPRTHLFIGPLR